MWLCFSCARCQDCPVSRCEECIVYKCPYYEPLEEDAKEG